ncbi:MAG: TonB-dependent receptor [Acidobacteriota bacterium]|nr:MAG: TonB-dependent receptor [Acidobacteriota bacterium]
MKKTLCLTTYLAWLALHGLVLGAPTEAAQTTIRGTLYDETGAALPGVTVTMRSLQTNFSKSVVSDGRGYYELSQLDAGDYEIEAGLRGFRRRVVGLTVSENEVRTLDITLEIAPFAETVTVTRADQTPSAVPKAVSLIGRDDIQLAQRKVSLDESLRSVPGLFVANRRNFSLSGGVRLSIRAPLSSFGMRGLQLLQDGIPLTTADGTTQPTNIDLGSAGLIEIIRGPSSVLYGNSAGGVISVRTEDPPSEGHAALADIQFGSYGYQRQQLKAKGSSGTLGYVVNASRMTTDGFRDHSYAETRQANLMIRNELSPNTEIRGVFNFFDMPFGASSSTLTREDALNNPTSVRRLAIAQGWGESSTQGQGGLTVEHRFGGGRVLRTTGWAMWRDLWNPIPFRIIDLGRLGSGLRSEYMGTSRLGSLPLEWTTGFDLSYQRDHRKEFKNEGVGDDGGHTQQGDLQMEQLEEVLSAAPFVQVSLALRPRWLLTAGLRYDHYNFKASDRFLTDGDQSGDRNMSAASPMVGVTYSATDSLNVYTNFATAYQTPTTVELSNRPEGEGGFNQDLDPADLRSFELGARGLLEKWRLRYELAGYVSRLDKAFVSFQREDEQTFFRNAGESSRNGIEALLTWTPSSRVETRLAYTYQDFTFKRFVTEENDYSGNREPGAPPQQLFLSGSYETSFGLRSIVQYRWVDAYPVNNANTVSNWSYGVVDLRFGLDRKWKSMGFQLFLGVDNLFDERYNASTWTNAFRNRFFEPAPDRELYVGVEIGVGP